MDTATPQPPYKFTAGSFRGRTKTPLEAALWSTSAGLTRGALETYGNVLSRQHYEAVQAVCDLYTAVTVGAVQGRFAVALPTGTSKTLSAACFIAALSRMDLPHSVVVCAEKVQQLITFKRELLQWGVEEHQIGLWYADDYRTPDGKKPSEPRTEKPEERQFLLLTHARARGKSELSKLNLYQGEPRSLWIYDESLLASSHVSFDLVPFVNAAAWFRSVAETWKIRTRYPREDRERRTRLLALADYIDNEAVPMLKKELLAQVERGRSPKLLSLPHVGEEKVSQWKLDLLPVYGRTMKDGGGRFASLLQKFTRMLQASLPLRVAVGSGGESAMVSFAIVVPKELQRLVVLDASYPVRLLENMDKQITHVEGFEDIKDWSQVALTIEKGPSGRESISTNFAEHARWAIEKIKQYPSTDPVLVLTFKDRPDTEDIEQDERREYRRRETKLIEKFKQALDETGVPNPLVSGGPITKANPEGLWDRVQFLTFGNETSLSDYKHIPHVIFLGVLHRRQTDLMGAILGQSGDLLRPLESSDVWASSLGEQAHGIYQGLSRGTCRTVINGVAQAMTVDLRHHDPHALWEALAPVMPGTKPSLPPPPKPTTRQQDAQVILAALARLQDEGRESISSRAMKILAGLSHLDSVSFSRALDLTLSQQGNDVTGWARLQQSIVRVFA